METLQIYKSPYEKRRIGRNRDGGYVIAWNDKLKYDLFISGGISNDISFEEDFINKYGKKRCVFLAYDGSIQKLPKKNPRIKFFKKMITPESDEKNTNLKNVIQNASNIFLKMDIEGSEYDVIEDIINSNISITQILVEFHDRLFENGYQKSIKIINALKLKGYEIFAVSESFEEVSFINKNFL